ncbi:hypothetical protein C8J57DRAFT_1291114 [Mycena rebaudengoi]|nr:hypothetical protein C8J57DRAFT_1291114 [Mycena rebaudengoi]
MSNNRSPTDSTKPIPIAPSAFPRGRPRSLSVSSSSSSGSAGSPTEIPTPLSASATSHRINKDDVDKEVPAAAHARRASTVVAGRFSQPQNPCLLRRLSLSSAAFNKPTDGQPRNRSPPNAPPNTAVSPTQNSLPFARNGKPRRSATLSVVDGRPRRAPSPMGERILKGHFDGFN